MLGAGVVSMLACLGEVCFTPAMDANTIIKLLGGTFEVARLCDTTPQAVSQWRKKGIPKSRLMYLRVVRPDVFGEQPEPSEHKPEAALPPVHPPPEGVEPGYPLPVHDDRRAEERRDAERRTRGEQRKRDRRSVDRRDDEKGS